MKKNVVAPEEALKKAVAKAEFKAALERAGMKLGGAAGEKSDAKAA